MKTDFLVTPEAREPHRWWENFVSIEPNIPERKHEIGQPPVSRPCQLVVKAFADFRFTDDDYALHRLIAALWICHQMQDVWHDIFFLINADGEHTVAFTRVVLARLQKLVRKRGRQVRACRAACSMHLDVRAF